MLLLNCKYFKNFNVRTTIPIFITITIINFYRLFCFLNFISSVSSLQNIFVTVLVIDECVWIFKNLTIKFESLC